MKALWHLSIRNDLPGLPCQLYAVEVGQPEGYSPSELSIAVCSSTTPMTPGEFAARLVECARKIVAVTTEVSDEEVPKQYDA